MMVKDKMYNKLRKFLNEVVGVSEYDIQIVVNTGDRIKYSSDTVQPLTTYLGRQYLLVGDLFEFSEWLKEERTYGKFVFQDVWSVKYMREDKLVYIGDFYRFLVLHILLGIQEFYCYNDFTKTTDSNVACVGYNPKKKVYYGWTHRAIGFFKVGDKIKYKPDLLILSHGYIAGCPNYEEEEKRIELVKSWFEDGVLVIDSEEKAKMLALRLAEATS